jgi:hypothetical protein
MGGSKSDLVHLQSPDGPVRRTPSPLHPFTPSPWRLGDVWIRSAKPDFCMGQDGVNEAFNTPRVLLGDMPLPGCERLRVFARGTFVQSFSSFRRVGV